MNYVNEEHRELAWLRTCITTETQAKSELKKLQEQRRALKFNLEDPSKHIPYYDSSTAKMKEEFTESFLAPYKEAAEHKALKEAEKCSSAVHKSASKKNTFIIVGRIILIILLIAVGIAAIIGGGYLIVKTFTWSWNSSILNCINKKYLWSRPGDITYPMAVGSYCYSLALFSVVVAFIFGVISVATKCNLIHIGTAFFGIAAFVSIIAGTINFYSDATGFWLGVGYFFVSIIFIPKILMLWIYIIPFILLILVTIAAIVGVIFLIVKIISSIIDKEIVSSSYQSEKEYDAVYNSVYQREYNPPKIDFSPLFATEKYKSAQKADEKKLMKAKEEYKDAYYKQLSEFNKLVKAYEDAIKKYQDKIGECVRAITSCNLLSDKQKNVETVDLILYYFDNRRARTVPDALNCYEEDSHRNRMEKIAKNTQTVITTQFEGQTRAIMQEMSETRRVLEDKAEEIQENASRIAKEQREATDRIVNEQRRSANRIAEEQRRSADRIAEGQSNISRGVNGIHDYAIRDHR